MRFFSLLFFFCCFLNALSAQIDPVKWEYGAKKINSEEYEVTFVANVDNGWYIYSQHTDPSGPVPTSINFEDNEAMELIGKTIETGDKKEAFDDLFGVNVIKFAKEVVFTQKVKVKKEGTNAKGYLEFMSCDDEKCLPPKEVEFTIPLK